MLFDLGGTLVDSVYQHVLAWREALENAGIDLSGGDRREHLDELGIRAGHNPGR